MLTNLDNVIILANIKIMMYSQFQFVQLDKKCKLSKTLVKIGRNCIDYIETKFTITSNGSMTSTRRSSQFKKD